jgi:hypothetical protein
MLPWLMAKATRLNNPNFNLHNNHTSHLQIPFLIHTPKILLYYYLHPKNLNYKDNTPTHDSIELLLFIIFEVLKIWRTFYNINKTQVSPLKK